ncbi:neutral zinc metallopeptidase [Streptomyces sp. XD-27]|uniref:neutral zinc metallopeptidase n=1 Tax=Streptomyces sp. XD-27 TaxID=3062779 RepID=UPI0026F47D0F|nr:neutral zinc metallopeptidase [Streptomyces sp. XD-27]WKX73168.1 neutral zinc metallopeptidase [Streptomyces sp. XD-27]
MAARWYVTVPTALVAALALLLTGCGDGGGGGTPRSPGGTTSPAPPSPPGGDETVEDDIDAAVRATDGFWSAHWTELFTGGYRSPQVSGAYDGAAPDVPLCGDEPLPDDNAVYCPAGDYVAWDLDLMRQGHRMGDAWVYLVIAHEWGHAIQSRLNEELVSLAGELQADCLAGAALFGAARDGTLRIEEGDTRELAQALAALADATPWTDTTDHGDASERIASFSRGAESGVRACLPDVVR